MLAYKLIDAGDTGVAMEFSPHIDITINGLVLAAARTIEALHVTGIIELVPTFRSLMIRYDPLVISREELDHVIAGALRQISPQQNRTGRLWRIPVCYDEAFALDGESVCDKLELDRAALVERHASRTYYVYMIGFLPGQAYMGDLPTEMELPRQATPRVRIPAGSVGIAGKITCIFPRATPSGWHILGRSPLPLWDANASRPLLAAGDSVLFEPISLQQFTALNESILAGSFIQNACE